MVLTVGFVLVAIYVVMMMFGDNLPLGVSVGGAATTAVLFTILAGVQMYLAERQPPPR